MTGVRKGLMGGALIWAVLGMAVALASFGAVDDDARFLVGFATVGGPLAATAAAWALRRGSDRTAGALLLASVLTPTYFAAVLNLPALVVGAVLLAAPTVLLRSGAMVNTA